MRWSPILVAVVLVLSTAAPVDAQCPPVFGIQAATNCDTAEVAVSWTNPPFSTLDSIEVRAIDTTTLMVVAEVILPAPLVGPPPNSTEFPLDPGNYAIQITRNCVGGLSSVASVPHNHAAGFVDRTNVVMGLEGMGLINSAGGWVELFAAQSKDYVSINSFDQLCPSQLSPGDVVWVCCGTFPGSYSLTISDGLVLSDLILGGISVYLEGADVWGFDPLTSYADYDGVAGLASDDNVMDDGDDSCNQISGLAHAGLDLTGWSEAYGGDNPGDDRTDRLFPTGFGPFALDLLGGNAGPIIRKTNGPAPSHYNVGIYYVTDLPGVPGVPGDPGKAVSNSIELGQSDDGTKTEVMLCLKGAGNAPFERGDCNADGACNLADAVALLDFLFGTSPEPFCVDACDLNDDGAVDLGDVIYKLSFLFTGGAAPPEPFGSGGCAPDPTPDALPCLFPTGSC